ncbi:MAG: lipopolysaccharide assembly protein LapB [Oxalobacter sp.]|nr:MAG: lipopolysaccharide assembly protein LapB [Oxalobacter sp.]
MDFEIWWLFIIPLFFGLGWIAARIDIKQLLSESRTLPHSYYKGLNFLLNEQPDKAIDSFIEIVKLDPETAELHFALGSLFCRRGEIERAIRVHQNLLSRPDLPREQQEQALFELGQDYLMAGLFDRAEETFNRLIDTQYGSRARRALLEIYQRVKEWQRAIDAAEALQHSGAARLHKEIAQFYCELAQDELLKNNHAVARTLLEKALVSDGMSVRATILTGDALLAQGDAEAAITAWRRVEKQSTPHVALVAQRLMDAYQTIGRPQEGLNLLKAYLNEAPSIDLLDVVFKATIEREGIDPAYQLILAELRRTPTLLGLDKLIEARMLLSPTETRSELSLVQDLVHGYAVKLARYQCSHCGFKARQFYWQCPGCNQWETYPPRRTEELTLIQ